MIVTLRGSPGRQVLAGAAATQHDRNQALQQPIIDRVAGNLSNWFGLNAPEQRYRQVVNHGGAARDAVQRIGSAVKGLQPKAPVLRRAAAGIFVHGAKPAGELVLNAQDAIGAVLENFLRRFNGGVLDTQPALLRALGAFALFLG